MKRKILYPKDSLNKDFEKKIIKKDKIKQEYLFNELFNLFILKIIND